MTLYILDTNVISAARKAHRTPQIAAWLAGQAESDLSLSAITIGEIERGIRLQDPKNPAFAADLRRWLDRTVALFSDRILPFNEHDALVWGRLSAEIGHPGADLMIAAQAIARNAVVVTGNAVDFAPTGAEVLNPF